MIAAQEEGGAGVIIVTVMMTVVATGVDEKAGAEAEAGGVRGMAAAVVGKEKAVKEEAVEVVVAAAVIEPRVLQVEVEAEKEIVNMRGTATDAKMIGIMNVKGRTRIEGMGAAATGIHRQENTMMMKKVGTLKIVKM